MFRLVRCVKRRPLSAYHPPPTYPESRHPIHKPGLLAAAPSLLANGPSIHKPGLQHERSRPRSLQTRFVFPSTTVACVIPVQLVH